MSISVPCTWCGESIIVADDHADATVPCPKCGSTCGLPASASRRPSPKLAPPADLSTAVTTTAKKAAPALPPVTETISPTAIRAAAPPRTTTGTDDDDGKPYGMTDVVKRCPNCAKVLADDAITCPGCELNLETGTFPERTFERVERHWETGLPLDQRRRYFLAYEAGLLVLGLMFFWQQSTLGGLIYYGVIISAAAAFVLGTYPELDLIRNERGRILFTRMWRVAFFRADTTTIKLGDYEQVVTTATFERGFFEWLILIWLLLSGVLPGIIWWIYFSGRETYQVALCQDHGYPAMILYRGWNQEQAQEIAKTLNDVWDFPRAGT